MINIHPANVAFYWATLFFRRLQEQGVRQVVISPGSRSTPLTLAAAAHPHLRKHVVLDERSAGFTALGMGKATNNPAVLICTSGTALANYYPAVIEARRSGIPLILATADRPPHLRATGANQATDQLKIFGDYPVFFHEVGEPRLDNEDTNRLRLLADQAVSATKELRGPAHLNFPFRKPLEPKPDFLQKIAAENKEREEFSPGGKREAFHLSKQLTERIAKAEKPLIMVGPTAPGDDLKAVGRLADQLQIPVLSESPIPAAHRISGFTGFLRNHDLRQSLRPDLVLRFGFQPATKALEQAITDWSTADHLHFASTPDWHDATFSGAKRIFWRGRRLSIEGSFPKINAAWIEEWKKEEDHFAEHVDRQMNSVAEMTDGGIYHRLTPQLQEDTFITVSNSFPARDIHLFGDLPPSMPLYTNRGVSGIDGVTSTAMGLSASLDRPGVLFTGDLAFLHDSNALLNHRLLTQPLVVVVVNNSGGSIFRMLPVEQHEEYFNRYFETPQSVELQKLAEANNLPYQLIDKPGELKQFNLPQWMNTHHGLSVVECRTDASASMRLRKRLWDY